MVRGIEIRNGSEGIKVGKEKERTVKVGCWFELNEKLIGTRIGVSADILERVNAQFEQDLVVIGAAEEGAVAFSKLLG